VLNVINTAFGLVSALSVTLTISPKLTLAALTPLPLLVLVTVRFSREMFTRTRDNQAAIGKLSEQVQSSIAGVRVVRAFGLESQQLEQFERSNQLYLEKSLSLARLRGLLFPLMQAIISIGILVVFWYGGHLILVGDLTTGGFLAFYRALARLTWPLIALGFLMGMLQRGRAAYARLAEIYTAEPDVVDGPLPAPARIEGRLEIKNLTFAHDNVPALSGVTLTLERGQSLAIVGRIASGKSTLAALLARLLPTPRGSVFLDGTDICDLPLSTVRSAIGYVQQTAFLFSTTAGRNIGFSLDQPDAGPSLLTIREAARQARILDELLALPDGLDTVVGERGVQLSGGQRQRVSLARAFVSDPKILVLDDPLSSVDADTEKGILAAIEHQSAVRGLILITHRVSAASRCDQILVLDRGKVVERGSHGELLAKGGLYARFAEEQRIERELEALGDGEPNTVAVALA
jgi:ATP-binding cassette subfamily B protein